jgi:hypothetical protein
MLRLCLERLPFWLRSKAVADGAVIWNCLQTVKARVARRSFGTGYLIQYDPAEPSHRGRELSRGEDGVTWVGPVWDCLLSKVWLPMTSCVLAVER